VATPLNSPGSRDAASPAIPADHRRRSDAAASSVATGDVPPAMNVRDDDLEPHAGLRYIARLFKVLAILIILLFIAELVIGLVREGSAAIPTLLVQGTRLIVFAGVLWGAADMGLMLIESNHDLRATRILVGRLNGRLARLEDEFMARSRGGTGGVGGTGSTPVSGTGAVPPGAIPPGSPHPGSPPSSQGSG
jgi:hypothetical protein